MIDSHTHSKYSKHAIGTIEDIVVSAIENKIQYLTITDHAPFSIDINNRLLENELKSYFDDINSVQSKYSKDITILKGLEVDFVPQYKNYTENLISNMELDFVIGSVHFIFLENKRVNIWDIENIHDEKLIAQYFLYLKELIQSNLFDTIGHPDAILRGGISEDIYCDNFYPLIELMQNTNTSYELNTSGLRKSTYDIKTNNKNKGIWNFPSKSLLSILNDNNISFTIGSDAHKPNQINMGIQTILKIVKTIGIEKISYYQNRNIIHVDIDKCITKEDK
jgi:histidinol-phosphatase (PHP family)